MELHHDPRTKQQLKTLLYEFMYTPVIERYKKRLSAIILKNCTLISSPYECFNYKGEVYVVGEAVTIPKKMPRLSPQLFDDMNKYLADLKALNTQEIPYVLGYINQVLNSSNDLPDYLRLLPSIIHAPIQKVIETCGCRTTHLTPEVVQAIQAKNQQSIELIKQRLVLNLIE